MAATAVFDAQARTSDRLDGARSGLAPQLWCVGRRNAQRPSATEDCERAQRLGLGGGGVAGGEFGIPPHCDWCTWRFSDIIFHAPRETPVVVVCCVRCTGNLDSSGRRLSAIFPFSACCARQWTHACLREDVLPNLSSARFSSLFGV